MTDTATTIKSPSATADHCLPLGYTINIPKISSGPTTATSAQERHSRGKGNIYIKNISRSGFPKTTPSSVIKCITMPKALPKEAPPPATPERQDLCTVCCIDEVLSTLALSQAAAAAARGHACGDFRRCSCTSDNNEKVSMDKDIDGTMTATAATSPSTTNSAANISSSNSATTSKYYPKGVSPADVFYAQLNAESLHKESCTSRRNTISSTNTITATRTTNGSAATGRRSCNCPMTTDDLAGCTGLLPLPGNVQSMTNKKNIGTNDVDDDMDLTGHCSFATLSVPPLPFESTTTVSVNTVSVSSVTATTGSSFHQSLSNPEEYYSVAGATTSRRTPSRTRSTSSTSSFSFPDTDEDDNENENERRRNGSKAKAFTCSPSLKKLWKMKYPESDMDNIDVNILLHMPEAIKVMVMEGTLDGIIHESALP